MTVNSKFIHPVWYIFFILLLSPFLIGSLVSPALKTGLKIPYFENAVIDGVGEEYETAFHTRLAGTSDGTLLAENDLSVNLDIGWTGQGLVLFVAVSDDSIVAGERHAWEGDGIEIFVADSCGSESTVQYSLAFLQPKKSDTCLEVFDRRFGENFIAPGSENKKADAICLIGKTRTKTGYNFEVLLPFPVLFGNDSLPSGMALDVWVNDADNDGNGRTQYRWNYSGKVLNTSWAMNSLVFDRQASGQEFQLRGQVIDEQKICLEFPFMAETGSMIIRDSDGKRHNYSQPEINSSGLKVFELKGEEILSEDYLDIIFDREVKARFYPDLLIRVYRESRKPNPYEEDIRCFEFRDKMNPPSRDATLFVGSSSIVMWKTLKRDMQGANVLNRGFGGSTARDLLHYFDRVVLPYHPGRIVYYEGDNDLGQGITPEVFVDSTRTFIRLVRQNLPETEIYLLSIKPSFARINLAEKVKQANILLKELAESTEGVSYIEVGEPMYDNGQLRKDIFLEDGLHMNATGYDIWTGIVRAALGLPPVKSSHRLSD